MLGLCYGYGYGYCPPGLDACFGRAGGRQTVGWQQLFADARETAPILLYAAGQYNASAPTVAGRHRALDARHSLGNGGRRRPNELPDAVSCGSLSRSRQGSVAYVAHRHVHLCLADPGLSVGVKASAILYCVCVILTVRYGVGHAGGSPTSLTRRAAL